MVTQQNKQKKSAQALEAIEIIGQTTEGIEEAG